MLKLGQYNRERAVDLLCERLAFERQGVKLYDRVLDAMRATPAAAIGDMLASMQKHRDQEEEHAHWLEAQIRELGGDDRAETDLSRLATRESRGIEEVVASDGADLHHLLHALLAAEAVDHAGWDLLVHLASDADDTVARREFTRRLHHEQEHLTAVRTAVERLSIRALFGERGTDERAENLASSFPP